MNNSSVSFSKKTRLTVILAVTLGNLLEWYEIYLFVYWAPTLSKIFFKSGSDNTNLIDTFLVFFLGFLARPVGGIVLGRLGDKFGRKKILVLSVLMMVIPTILIGLLPTYATIGPYSILILSILRILQSFPAGGEVPGAACYLYESSHFSNRKYMTSWTAVGIQSGIFIATIECFLLEKLLNPEKLLDWGWRASFLTAGCIGICGLLLRSKLHETPLFQEISHQATVIQEPFLKILNKYKIGITKSILYCFLVSPAFYFVSINFSSYFNFGHMKEFLSDSIINACFLLLVTVPVPFIGKLADTYSLKKIIITSTILVMFSLIPLYFSINNHSYKVFITTTMIFCLGIASITALTPYLVCDLFPTRARFTGVALGYNLVDAIIGGITPAAMLALARVTDNKGSFCWILLACATISLISFFFIQERHPHRDHKEIN